MPDTEICSPLGEPVPSEIERKFLIKMPTAEQIKNLGCVSRTQIIQTYLQKGENTAERRIRQRGEKNGFTCYYTEKTMFLLVYALRTNAESVPMNTSTILQRRIHLYIRFLKCVIVSHTTGDITKWISIRSMMTTLS